VPFVQLAINNKLSGIADASPFSIFFNRTLNPFVSYASFPHDAPINRAAWIDHQRHVHAQLFPSLISAVQRQQQRMQAAHDRKHSPATPLSPGTVVMLLDPTRASKNQPPYLGPYTVASRASASTYYIRDEPGALFHRPVPIDHLKVLRHAAPPASWRAQRYSEPPPPAIPSDQFYVDRLMRHRVLAGGGFEYLVRWTGFGPDSDSWVPALDIEDSLVQAYLASRSVVRECVYVCVYTGEQSMSMSVHACVCVSTRLCMRTRCAAMSMSVVMLIALFPTTVFTV
jgi:hypothetical protein